MGAFFLVPIKGTILRGDFEEQWPDIDLAVLLVLLAHENRESRIASPSLGRIAALAGISKTSAYDAVHALEGRFFSIQALPALGGAARRFEYRMHYAPYQKGSDKRKWLHLPASLVHRGILAEMAPAVRRLYLTLHAISWPGQLAGDPNCQRWDVTESECDYRFIDEGYTAPANLRKLSGVGERSFSRAWNWLCDNRILLPNDEGVLLPDGTYHSVEDDTYAEGFIMPNIDSLRSERILERVAKVKAESSKVKAEGKRLKTRTSRRIGQRNTAEQTSSPFRWTPSAASPAISVPYSCIEPVSEPPF